MGSDSFVHLHVHSEYSMLDGASRVEQLADRAAADTQPALALTDHGALFGLVDFYRACRARGVKPILGAELYQAQGSRFAQERTVLGERYYHLTALAVDDVGYRNLVKLSTRAYLEGLWHKPRVDLELLAEHSQGMVVLSGCLSGSVNQHLTAGDDATARRALSDLRDIYTPERCFVELMDHGIAQQRRNWPRLEQLAGQLGLRTVVTNDSHYTDRDDAEAHDVLLCIQTNAKVAETNRLRFDGDDYHFKPAAAMRAAFADHREALDNTLLVAEMCDTTIEFGLDLLPRFPTPPGVTEAEHLRAKVAEGARRRYGDPVPAEVQQRLDHELGVIEQMGFPAYFLIVADLCDYARSAGIRVGPGRGSVGGSAVAYCTGITRVDPIRYGLIFERFLNPERPEMPDIDIDFDDRRRGEMIRYAADTYGDDRVAQIVTFATIKAKSAIRDATRVLDHPFALGDRLCKAMPPPVQGKEWPLADAFQKSAELRQHYEHDPDARQVLDTARKLEGLRRQHGIHAAAVLIGAKPLTDVIPLMKTDRDEIITQYEMNAAAEIGLLKMDFLGLRTLTVISDTERHIAANRGVTLDLDAPDAIPFDDAKTFEMLARGETLGVFQLDSSGMQALVRAMRPDSFDDIMALLALYRPGPLGENMHLLYAERKQGKRKVEFSHPALEPILEETYGVLVFQEQVLRLAVDIAGYSMGEADKFRKAMGKKDPRVMAAERTRFVEGAVAGGYERRWAEAQFQLIERFAEYGFNKAHTCAYGVVSYQTAWLKANYPVEYMAALLTSVKNHKDNKPLYLSECRRMGIPVLPPDVNDSDVDFTPRGDEIRFGLAAVRGVGDAIVDAVITARRSQGRFTDFADFCHKVDASVLNKRVLEALILAGAFASLGHTRAGLLQACDSIAEAALARKRSEAAGQFSLFDSVATAAPVPTSAAPMAVDVVGGLGVGGDAVIPVDEFDHLQLLKLERSMLGSYVTAHPLSGAERLLEELADATVSQLRERDDGAVVAVAGVLTGLVKKFTRKGDTYLVAELEDLTGVVETVFWPSIYRATHEVLSEDRVLLVTGRLEVRDDTVKLAATQVTEPDLSEVRGAAVVVTFAAEQCTREAVARLKRVLANHAGHVPVQLRVVGSGGDVRVYQLGDAHRVVRRPGLFGEIKSAFGADAVGGAGARTFSAPDDRRGRRREPATV